MGEGGRHMKVSTDSAKELGLIELVAIALGGMIGGGIFSILGLAVEQVGNAAPIAIAVGALLAFLAAHSYASLSRYFQDEGATYAFFKRTYPDSHHAAATIGWLVVFGYLSTLGQCGRSRQSRLGGGPARPAPGTEKHGSVTVEGPGAGIASPPLGRRNARVPAAS